MLGIFLAGFVFYCAFEALRTAWDTGVLAAGQNWGTGLPPPGAVQTSVIGLFKTIDDYAELEMGHREYFWGRPHSAGCKHA